LTSRKKKEKAEQTLVLKKTFLTAKTPNQKKYIQAVDNNRLVFCSGPAGTGKTHIAVASAVLALSRKKVEKIIIARPMVCAEEEMGYLPGEILSVRGGSIGGKASPFLRPIFDEMRVYLSHTDLRACLQNESIEVVTFAHMRGRTFKNAFIVADECQNATHSQLLMILTRIGENSKMVLTGDASQSDLPHRQRGAFKHFMDKLVNVEDITVSTLQHIDSVRDKLVERIIQRLGGYNDEPQESVGTKC